MAPIKHEPPSHHHEVIDLCEDSPPPESKTGNRKRNTTITPAQVGSSSTTKKLKLESTFEAVDEGDKKPAAKNYQDDDVELLDASLMSPILHHPQDQEEASPSVASPFARRSSNNDEEEVTMVGTKNQIRLPHMRQHCTRHPFKLDTPSDNTKHCDLCYCYVCDVPVKECTEWSSSHCQACDYGPREFFFRTLRHTYRANKQSKSLEEPNHLASTSSETTLPIKKLGGLDQICQHCNFHNIHRPTIHARIQVGHFCTKCNGVVSKKYLARIHKECKKLPSHCVSLGQKTIGYRVVGPNPPNPSVTTEWVQEIHDYLIGPRPDLSRVLQAIPPRPHREIKDDPLECRAIIFDDMHQVNMLSALHEMNSRFGVSPGSFVYHEKESALLGSLSTSFDPVRSQGTLLVDVYLRVGKQKESRSIDFTCFLGHWFGVLPLKFSEVDLPLKLASRQISSRETLNESEVRAKDELKMAALQYNKQLDEKLHSVYTLSSSDSRNKLGGVSKTSSDFGTSVHNLFREIIYDYSPNPPPSLSPQNGKAHVHRQLRTSQDEFLLRCPLRNFLSPSGYILSSLLSSPRNEILSIDSLMNHLTNRGHEAAPFVKGLTVELLPFQQQSLQWAYERETMIGGIQASVWPKLPLESDQDVYFNPVLGTTSLRAPRLVRGGILAEQMGLGKTIISLALILKNPAPVEPTSGSAPASIDQTPDRSQAFWDPSLPASGSGKGSILSRGTLVVCNVSLVGQWVAEAKSKLTNPGLVYAYHGGNRKRDPKILAGNEIVVTTYETLSKDNTYHRMNSKDPETYVSPCEKIRWWRIICDEGHVLRSASGKTEAVKSLIGDNKWIVSGTPICTSISDLKNQLEFLGIQHVSKYQSAFRNSVYNRVDRKRSRDPDAICGPFMFVMRTLLMRHTQSQKYVGTDTTLMSLPEKTERSVIVPFCSIDKAQYKVLEVQSRSNYASALTQYKGKVNKHYLAFKQLLTPLQIACAGGLVYPTEQRDEHSAEDLTTTPAHTFTSKFSILIDELTKIRQNDPTAKSLVFSQFKATLDWLKAELPKHGFAFRSLSGDMSMAARAKALRDFQNDPPTTIFLLSMRAGAVGINLTQANRVFIMEPCFNPAVEAQAIGRVHRLGQTRPVEIIRLLMENSIETRMHKMIKDKYGGDQLNSTAKVGSISTDKAEVLRDEFDTLFGLEMETPNITHRPPQVTYDSADL